MKGKVLIIEDDADTRFGVGIRLKSAGYEIVVAADAAAAIQVAQRENPDLILLDLGLPGGDGLDVLERLKKMGRLSDVPVIVVSARDPQLSRPHALQRGAAEFLSKPVDNEALLSAIDRHLRTRREGQAGATGRKILIIEDDADTRLGFSARLRASGYQVVTAADSVSGTTVALKEKPELIMLDLGLPGGDGFMLMERFRSNPSLAGIPIIVVSAREPIASSERARAAGAVAFLQKPPDNQELLATIRRALGE